MSKKFIFNAFEMNCVGHQSPGLWAHPHDRSWQYKDLEYWTDLAKLLEKGIFTAIFIADVVGYYDVYNDSARAAVQNGVQIPVNDPLQIAGPVAQATKHIGIGITSSTSFEHPYTWARRIATADHYTKGRVGWNIVTSYLESGAKNVGDNSLNRHDNRYEIAEEYLEVIYKLLEGSWEEDAVVRDREKRIFANPDKVHEIGHKGKYFDVPGIGLTEPSPQRTPVLFQAGSSAAGKKFAAQNAELVFVSTPGKKVVKEYVADVRRQAKEAGRDPAKVLVLALVNIVVDETDEKAQAKYEDYKKYISYEGTLSLISGWSGVDLSKYGPDEPLKHEETNAIISIIDHLTNGEEDWTPRKLADWVGVGGLGPVFIGSATTVADALQAWVAETDVDGFNISYGVSHETFADVVEYLVPELQRRGVYPTEYKEGTLREKIFGTRYLPDEHPGSRYRDIEKVKREEAAKR
ncbi:N5,N10-methylene tetrahydromethanopterin reductase [Betaproteobacteria bacterium]|nr:N5,N10-methylene tetrahydromethanopterin reductase [Betaproteobacteria bacterium]GHU21151.1 N5,N10-methylene tetrahydromethanopterin reductase [Betaproteobacteria bacterium]